MWFDRLAEKYHTPASVLEQLLATPVDLQHEIARLIADVVLEQARELVRLSPQERITRKRSTDWFDQLVVARWRRDHQKDS